MGGMMGSGMMGWAAIWSVVVILLLAAAATALIVLAVKSARNTQTKGGGAGSGEAHEILRARFARGEIDDEEYRRRLGMLDQQ